MLMNIWTGDWKNRLEIMNTKVDEDNGKATGTVNGRYRNIRRFSSNQFWKNIGCIISAPSFGLGGLIMWDKE